MVEQKEILGVYKELKGILASMESENSWFIDNGFAEHANVVIDRAGSTCIEIRDINSYKLNEDVLRDGRVIIHTIQAKQKLNSLIGRIEGVYGLEDTKTNNGNTFIQNQLQTQSQNLSVILDVHEKILTELPKHAQGTAERTFLEKLKEALPTIKNVTEIL